MIWELRRKLKRLALLDAIIEPDWQFRYFSYNSNWSDTEEVGSLRDGSGNAWFLWGSGPHAAYKCVNIDDGLMPNPKNAMSNIPSQYNDFKNEPAFSMNEASCIWYLAEEEWVKIGLPIKWAFDLSKVENWDSTDYCTWATTYYEKDINPAAVEKIFEGKYDDTMAVELNSEVDLVELRNDLNEIGIHVTK